MRRTLAYDIKALISALEPRIRDAFIASVSDIRSEVQIAVLVKAIEEGRIDDAIRALNLGPEFYEPLNDVLRAAYLDGGRATILSLPRIADPASGSRLVLRFDGQNPQAEAWVKNRASGLIVEIVKDQVDAVRAALTEGLTQGQNPRDTALEIVGRIDRATGRRTGGILGLTSQQAGFVANARAELRDPKMMDRYLGRALRDKRYDRMVLRAIRDQKPLAEEDVQAISNRYTDRMLKYRGDMIARTETLTALHASQYEAMRQLIDTGKVRADQVVKTWSATMDSRTRDSHAAMNGQQHKFDEPFTAPSGARMRYPQDTALGAGPEEIIACRCYMTTRIKYL